MQDCVEKNDKNDALLNNLDHRTSDLNTKLGCTTLSYAKRMNVFEKKMQELDTLLHKPNNFYATLKKETDKIN